MEAWKPGKQVPEWKFYRPASFTTGMAFSEGELFYGRQDGVVEALNAEHGKQKWVFAITHGNRRAVWAITTTPCVDDEAVYFGSHSGIFYKVTKSQGQDLWKFSENNYDGIVEGAFLQGSVLHFKTREGMFFRLDADSGRLISKVKVPEGFIPSISDGFTIAADNKTIFSSRLTRR